MGGAGFLKRIHGKESFANFQSTFGQHMLQKLYPMCTDPCEKLAMGASTTTGENKRESACRGAARIDKACDCLDIAAIPCT